MIIDRLGVARTDPNKSWQTAGIGNPAISRACFELSEPGKKSKLLDSDKKPEVSGEKLAGKGKKSG